MLKSHFHSIFCLVERNSKPVAGLNKFSLQQIHQTYNFNPYSSARKLTPVSSRPQVFDFEQRPPAHEVPYYDRSYNQERVLQQFEKGYAREQSYISPVKERNLILTPSKNANVLSFDFDLLEAWKMRYGYF